MLPNVSIYDDGLTEHLFYIGSSVLLATLCGIIVYKTIPAVSPMFIAAGLFGRDLNKKTYDVKVPESQGLISGTSFLIVMFVFLGIRFGRHIIYEGKEFPHNQFSESLASLLCICCMLLLGFADDVLNLKWRYKLILPTIASLPLLMVYYINFASTTIIVPKPLRDLMGFSLDIGFLYYVYMSLLAVFCTNAINIYAGINGIESGQTVIISLSIVLFNIIELAGYQRNAHLFSLTLLLPFSTASLSLYYYNRYPSKAFVGDTFTYFAGMTFAVVGIIGRFSKSVLLFFIPQVLNFLYSTPQLFRFIPCPRHRIPVLNKRTGLLEPSEVEFKSSSVPRLVLWGLYVLNYLKIVRLRQLSNKGEVVYSVNNLTIINLALIWIGPTKEDSLTRKLLCLQIVFSAIGFLIRYPLANFFYN